MSDFMKQALADGKQWDLVRYLAAVAIAQPGCLTWVVRGDEQVSVGVSTACNLNCAPPGHLGPAKACAQPQEPGACHPQVGS